MYDIEIGNQQSRKCWKNISATYHVPLSLSLNPGHKKPWYRLFSILHPKSTTLTLEKHMQPSCCLHFWTLLVYLWHCLFSTGPWCDGRGTCHFDSGRRELLRASAGLVCTGRDTVPTWQQQLRWPRGWWGQSSSHGAWSRHSSFRVPVSELI